MLVFTFFNGGMDFPPFPLLRHDIAGDCSIAEYGLIEFDDDCKGL